MEKSEEELYSLFNKTKSLTNNFTQFEYNLLEETPQSLIIFRLIFGLTQKEFSNILGMSQTHIYEIENRISNLSKTSAKHAIIKIKEKLEYNPIPIFFESIYKNYNQFKKLNVLTTERARDIRKLRKVYPSITRELKEENLITWKSILNTPNLARIIEELTGDGHLHYEKGE